MNHVLESLFNLRLEPQDLGVERFIYFFRKKNPSYMCLHEHPGYLDMAVQTRLCLRARHLLLSPSLLLSAQAEQSLLSFPRMARPEATPDCGREGRPRRGT